MDQSRIDQLNAAAVDAHTGQLVRFRLNLVAGGYTPAMAEHLATMWFDQTLSCIDRIQAGQTGHPHEDE